MKHVLSWEETSNRLFKGSENGNQYEAFEVIVVLYDDETNAIEEKRSIYKRNVA